MSKLTDTYHIDKIISESYGLWSSAIFSSMLTHNPNYSNEEHKKIFFEILKYLLEHKIIRFCSPEDPLGKHIPFWDTNSNTIIEYLEKLWPKTQWIDESTQEIYFYFYEVPAVLWRGEDGNYFGS